MSVGADVATARRARGLTIDEVSDATRVRATVLRRIEDDDFELCGGTVYAKGHLRAICGVVGLDPAEVLAAFDAEQGVPMAAPPAQTVSDPAYHESRQVNWTLVMAVALVAVLGFVGFRFLTVGGPGGSTSPVVTEAGASPAATDQGSDQNGTSTATPTPPRTSLPTDAVAAGPAVQMVLRTGTKRSWVQVSGSKGVLFSGVIEKDSSRRYTDPERLSVVIGNAGAVSLTVNGEDLGTAGRSGRVARLTFGPGNPNQG